VRSRRTVLADEEGQNAVVAGVEKEMRELRRVEVRLLEHQRHAEQVAVEGDRARRVTAHHRHVVGAGQVDGAVRRRRAHLVLGGLLHTGLYGPETQVGFSERWYPSIGGCLTIITPPPDSTAWS
jgi:hypothetical protein